MGRNTFLWLKRLLLFSLQLQFPEPSRAFVLNGCCCSTNGLRVAWTVFASCTSDSDANKENSEVLTPTKTLDENHEIFPRGKVRIDRAVLRNKLLLAITKHTGPATPRQEWKRLYDFLYRSCHGENKLSAKQVDQVMEFLSKNLSPDLVRRIVKSIPRILRKSVPTQLGPTFEFLASIYPGQLLHHALDRKPELILTRGIGYTTSDELNLMKVYLSQELRMSPAKIQKLEKNHGSFLFQLPMHKVLPIMAYFREILIEGKSDKKHGKNSKLSDVNEEQIQRALQKLVYSHPQLLQLSLDSNLRPRIEYLRYRCNLQPQDISLFLQGDTAKILGLSVHKNLAPTLDYLESILKTASGEVGTELLRNCILSHPQILGLSVKQNIETKVWYLSNIGHHRRTGKEGESRHQVYLASRVLQRAPTVFSLSLKENIVPTVEFLAKIWCAEDDLPKAYLEGAAATTLRVEDNLPVTQQRVEEQVYPETYISTETKEDAAETKGDSLAKLIGEYPYILTLSLKRNIMPTVAFYNRTGYIMLDREWRSVGKKRNTLLRGRYIASSLYERLLPRWHYMQLQNNRTEEGPRRIPLHILASATDQSFCKQMEIDQDSYYIYKKEAAPGLKFSNELDSWLQASGVVL